MMPQARKDGHHLAGGDELGAGGGGKSTVGWDGMGWGLGQ